MVALEIECACKNALEPGDDCRVSFGYMLGWERLAGRAFMARQHARQGSLPKLIDSTGQDCSMNFLPEKKNRSKGLARPPHLSSILIKTLLLFRRRV